jgi:hypothetical protein
MTPAEKAVLDAARAYAYASKPGGAFQRAGGPHRRGWVGQARLALLQAAWALSDAERADVTSTFCGARGCRWCRSRAEAAARRRPRRGSPGGRKGSKARK